MNELLFLGQSIATFSFILLALKIGKEWLKAAVLLQWVLANLFVLKQIHLFGLNATATDAFVVSGSLGIALVNEFCGKKEAKKVVWMGFLIMLFCALMSLFQLQYEPSLFDEKSLAYGAILAPMPRLLIASFIAYIIAEFVNVFLSHFLKQLSSDKFPIARWIGVAAVSQFIDTVLFTIVGLYGIASNLSTIILISFCIKCCALLISWPLISRVKKYVLSV